MDTLARTLVRDTVALCRTAPHGARSVRGSQLGRDLVRDVPRGRLTMDRWLRVILDAIEAGVDARLYGELVADVLGAAAATVLPVSDASLAETLTQGQADVAQERVVYAVAHNDVTVADLEAAIASERAHIAASQGYVRALCRKRMQLLRAERIA